MNNNNPIKNPGVGVIVLLWALIMSMQISNAQTYPHEYLEQVIENNPGLLSQHKAYEAAMQQADVASSLPDPQLNAGVSVPPMERLMGSQWMNIEIMQMFPWFGTLRAQQNVAEKMAEAKYQQYLNQRNQLFMNITRIWSNIYLKRKQLEILVQYQEILQTREDLIYTRFESGRQTSGAALDVYRLDIKVAELENRSRKLTEEIDALVQNFNILLGKERSAQVSTPDKLPPTPAFSNFADSLDFSLNPVLIMAQADLEAAEIRERLAQLNARPMLGLGLQYTYFAPGDPQMGQMDGGHMLMPLVSVSLPIYFRKNRARQTQSELLTEASRFEKNDQLNNLQMQWEDLKASLAKQQHDTQFYNRQLEITQKSEELILSGYSAGNEAFDDLLEIQDQLLDIEWRLLETQTMQQITLAEMDMLKARNIFESTIPSNPMEEGARN
jgi:outer membrane protein, heavy metal efflux system